MSKAPDPECEWCEEPIVKGDRYQKIPHVGTPGKSWSYFHLECFIRSIVGSVAHQTRQCSCCGGTGEDDSRLTVHQAAWDAYIHWRNLQVQNT